MSAVMTSEQSGSASTRCGEVENIMTSALSVSRSSLHDLPPTKGLHQPNHNSHRAQCVAEDVKQNGLW